MRLIRRERNKDRMQLFRQIYPSDNSQPYGKAAHSQDVAARVPPGQILTDKFPVLTYGPTPHFDPKTWDFKVVGLVEKPLRFSYEEFRALPQSREVADFHCVTTWSRLDNAWEGVGLRI